MSKRKKDVGAIAHKDGVSFRVWAPFASAVAVTGSFNNWSETALDNEFDGYWSTFIDGARAGQEYKFVIINNGNKLYRNDPRALHFTTAAGNSVIASSHFDWENVSFTPPPIEQQVIYEIHVGTFNRPDLSSTGTFRDVTDKLDYLASLGINMIEFMPIGTMLMDRGWGYAIDYIYSVESLYGGRYGFLQFVREAHRRGIGIILDVVYNHFGPDNSLDLWQFDGWNENGTGGIYFYNDWRAETPWGLTRPDFGRQEVQQYILDNVRMWMHDCRVDGLRVDSTIFIRNVKGNNNDPGNDLAEGWHLLQQINSLVRKINPAAITIAEDVAANEYIVKPVREGGAGFGAQWELGMPHALKEALKSDKPYDINMSPICELLQHQYNGSPMQRVVFTDSHDSAANGSARLWELLAPAAADGTYARKRSLIAAAIVLTTPGIPMLFQGQEFMEGGSFNDWQGLDWSKSHRHAGIVEAYKHLIALRKNQDGISAGLLGPCINLIHVDEVNKVLAYHRWQNGGAGDDVIVLINFGSTEFDSYALNFPRNGSWQVRFNSTWSGYSADFSDTVVPDIEVATGGGSITLPASSVIILSQSA